MVMDAYCGIGPWQQRDRALPVTPEETIRLMDHFAVDRALVYPNFLRGLGAPEHAVSLLEGWCAQQPRFEPLVPLFPHPYPDMPSVDAQFERMRAMGARAAWCSYPQYATMMPLVFADIFKRCQDERIPVLLEEPMISAERVDQICTAFPELRVIYAGVNYMADAWLFPLLRKHRHISVVLGPMYIPPWGPMRFVENFGDERLLFGSGLPEMTPGGMRTHVAYATISDEAKMRILGGNLERLMAEAWI